MYIVFVKPLLISNSNSFNLIHNNFFSNYHFYVKIKEREKWLCSTCVSQKFLPHNHIHYTYIHTYTTHTIFYLRFSNMFLVWKKTRSLRNFKHVLSFRNSCCKNSGFICLLLKSRHNLTTKQRKSNRSWYKSARNISSRHIWSISKNSSYKNTSISVFKRSKSYIEGQSSIIPKTDFDMRSREA